MSNLPVPVPRTFVVGETGVAAYLNAVRDALTFLLNPPMLVAYQGTVQSLPNGAFTAASLDQTLTDTYGSHSNTTNNSRMTAQVAGWYQTDGGISISANGTGNRDGQWAKNGSAITTPGSGLVETPSASFSTTQGMPGLQVFLNTGDYLELWEFQNSGGALNTNTSTFTSYISARWVHS